MKLEDRLHIAIKKLEELLAQNDEMYRRSDTERLRGKIDGIKLALSYLNEEKIQELSKIVDKHERMMEIAYEYSEEDTATNKKTSDCLCSGCAGLKVVGNETSDEREARTDRETSEKLKEKCRSCSGSRVLYTSVLHPTNPNLDSWITNPCHCTRRY